MKRGASSLGSFPWNARPFTAPGSLTNPSFSYRPMTLGSAKSVMYAIPSATRLAVSRSKTPLPSPDLCHAGCTCKRQENHLCVLVCISARLALR